mmetsp:Transcript_26742/g.23603  ORF Transcript_26742/g.23603 Transcript_26742/m.23603 type:complete len:214 (+) Transcript_26742:90-731(+)
MRLADGSIKKGMFENNTFIEEIAEENESMESSFLEGQNAAYGIPDTSIQASKFSKKKGKKKKKKFVNGSMLPHINTNVNFTDQSGRHYSSAKKPLVRNLSETGLKRNSQLLKFTGRKSKRTSRLLKGGKNTLSLPKIGTKSNEISAISSRLNNFSSVAKGQVKERKKLESYFKSLDRAVQILRDKKTQYNASRPWVPAGPIKNYEYRPSSKYG